MAWTRPARSPERPRSRIYLSTLRHTLTSPWLSIHYRHRDSSLRIQIYRWLRLWRTAQLPIQAQLLPTAMNSLHHYHTKKHWVLTSRWAPNLHLLEKINLLIYSPASVAHRLDWPRQATRWAEQSPHTLHGWETSRMACAVWSSRKEGTTRGHRPTLG